jgi:GNAT superfamily N-acetyltransferase
MTTILTDVSSPATVAAVEGNVVAWTRLKGLLPGVEMHDDGDAVWLFSTTPGRGGAVAGARFTEKSADERIAEILAYHRRFLQPTLWWTGPSSTPADLGKRLRAAGLQSQQNLPGMAADLDAIRTEFRRPEGLTIVALEDFSIFRRYEHPFFGPATTERRRNLIDGVAWMATQEPRRAWHFVASLAGVPVATIPKARGKGIGKAVTLAALEHARGLGYRVSILHASKQGEPIYRQIGFAEVCRVSHWYYSKMRQVRQRVAGR